VTAPWTDVVTAYEKELVVLEEARSEYAAAAKSLISAVAVRLRERELPRAEGTALAIAEGQEKDTVGRYRVDIDVSADAVPLLGIQVWVASAYGGESGKLRIGAYLEDEKATFASKLEERRLEAVGATGLDKRELPVDVGDEAVAMATVDIRSQAPEEQAAVAVAQILEKLNPIVGRWADSVAPIARARRGLLLCRDRLAAKPLVPEQVATPKPGTKQLLCEAGLAYVWMKEPDPSVWVGVRLVDGALVYAHDQVHDSDVEPAKAIADRLRAAQTAVGDFDGGVLMSGVVVRTAKDEQIAARAFEAFEAFRALAPPSRRSQDGR
jgi:hypothetical protein